jgi:hypothetical protein
MAKLKVTRADNSIQEFEVTPTLEVAYEAHVKKGFHKSMIEDGRLTDVYWLTWEAIRRSGETVKPFGDDFLETIKSVEVLDSDPLG